MSNPRPTLISIIIPCHNETENLSVLVAAIDEATRDLPERFELIFVDDGSTDNTLEVLADLSKTYDNIRTVELVRNFGKEIAITAGLEDALGQAAITIDADLQHPPAIIPELIAGWKAGAEVVIGIRRSHMRHAPLLKRAGSALFYKLINALSQVEIRAGASDYRLLDRAVIEEFNRFTERGRITRGLIDWLGFRRSYVYFVPAKRHAGTAAYSYYKLINLALSSVVSMSLIPLKVAGYLGFIIVTVTGPLGVFIFVEKYVMADSLGFGFTGPAILAVILLFVTGIILICLGLIALYIATIHTEVLGRPLYVRRRPRP